MAPKSKDKDLRQQILEQLVEVAPDVDPEAVDPEKNFRDQFEIDSVDFLNLVLGLEKRLGVRIPEYDYPKLSSLKGAMAYLKEKAAA